MSVAPNTQGSNNKARPTKVKDEGVTLAIVAAAATTTPPTIANSSSSPAASIPRSASSELINDDSYNVAVDTKNAPRCLSLFIFCFSELMLIPV